MWQEGGNRLKGKGALAEGAPQGRGGPQEKALKNVPKEEIRPGLGPRSKA